MSQSHGQEGFGGKEIEDGGGHRSLSPAQPRLGADRCAPQGCRQKVNEGPRDPSLSRRVSEPSDKADNQGTGKAAPSPSLSPTCYCTDLSNGGIRVTSAPLL